MGWLQLAAGGFLCADEARATRSTPGGLRLPLLAPGGLLPFRYVAVGSEGSGEYLQPEDAASDYFLRELLPGSAVTVERRLKVGGAWFWRTTRGTFVPAGEVYPVEASPFAGQALKGEWRLPLAFVHGSRAQRFTSPGRAGAGWLPRYHRAAVIAERGRFLELGPGLWVRRGEVRLARVEPPPPGVGPEEPWVDVDVSEQVLVAYRGPNPVFATLVSSGRRARTPLGTFRVWVKLAATDMRSGPREEGRPYQLWDVPWAAFFNGDFGLHGTYWHDRFGHTKSAGCVNLSPRDAKQVFQMLRPELLPGWWAVLSRPKEEGSVVRVRDGRRPPRPSRAKGP
ncbi:MAG: L,D-transpeptidase [Polyangia bacterium]|nr:L,D-transpeptidase [Polyangia bacterium]